MKRKDNFGLGGSIFLTVIFAAMAIFTYQTDSNNSFALIIPAMGMFVGIVMTIKAAIKASNESSQKVQQEKFAQSISYDNSFGSGNLKLYFDSKNKRVTICATSTTCADEKIVENFVVSKSVNTDYHIVSLDSFNYKVMRVCNNKGRVSLTECSVSDKLQEMNIDIKPSQPTIKAFNDYAFVTDDINKIVTIVAPFQIHVLRYSDIVSISYEENGNNVFNKSLGGAVVGGLLFGGVGAIVGSNTAKAKQNKEITSMAIKILLKSTSNSTIMLTIYEAGKDGSVLQTKETADRTHYEGLIKEVSGIIILPRF